MTGWSRQTLRAVTQSCPIHAASATGEDPLRTRGWLQHFFRFPAEPNLGEDDEDKDLEPGPSGTSKASAQLSGQSDTDITAEFLQPLLTPDNVANLVSIGGGGISPHWVHPSLEPHSSALQLFLCQGV